MSRHLDRSVATGSWPHTFDVSIVESFAQLDLSTDGPFSRLPNELVDAILARLEMQELIPMQVVSEKWQAVIYLIGNKKKSLSVAKSNICSYDINFLKKRSFGQIDLSTFTHIKVTPFWSEHFTSQLVNLFPNIESIVMDLPLSDIIDVLPRLGQLTTLSFTFRCFPPSNEYAKLLELINSCASLKRLDIQAQIYCQMSLLEPTLARLEQFSYLSYEESLVEQFGPNCSRVCLDLYYEEDRTQWHTVNGQWLANVTHLKLTAVSELDRLIEYLSQHAVSLQVLCLEGRNYTRMNSQLIGHLSKLEHLTELELSYILVDLPQLEEAARMFQLVPLDLIRTFTLSPCNFVNLKDGNQLTSILCTILPNVEHLNLRCNFFNFKLESFEQYLHRFAKLRSHSF